LISFIQKLFLVTLLFTEDNIQKEP